MVFPVQVVGHMFAYPLIHDLVADSGEEKAEAKELVDSIVGMSHPLFAGVMSKCH